MVEIELASNNLQKIIDNEVNIKKLTEKMKEKVFFQCCDEFADKHFLGELFYFKNFIIEGEMLFRHDDIVTCITFAYISKKYHVSVYRRKSNLMDKYRKLNDNAVERMNEILKEDK